MSEHIDLKDRALYLECCAVQIVLAVQGGRLKDARRLLNSARIALDGIDSELTIAAHPADPRGLTTDDIFE